MFSCSGDLSVIMWNVYDGSIINKLELKGIPKNICYNNDNKKLLVYCIPLSKRSIPTLYIYNTINFQEPIIFTLEENKITSLNWLNNDVIIVSYESGEIEFMNLLDKAKNEKYKLHDNIIKSVNFNNTKTKLVTGSIDKTCKIFDIETRKVEQTIVSDISINSALFFPLRNYIIMGGGLDALLVISDLEQEIRSKLRYDSGEFKEFNVESYDGDGNKTNRRVRGCDDTLEQVWNVLLRFKQERNLPELT